MRTFATNSIIMNNLRDNSLMTYKAKLTHFFALPFWRSWTTITVIYTLIPIIIGLLKWHKNNDTYHIYKSVFWNTVNQLPLYEFYDYLKGDCNHYGVIFAYVIGPFAVLPDTWGMLLWECFLVAVFYIGVRYMPLERWQKVFMFWFCLHEVLTPLFVEQFESGLHLSSYWPSSSSYTALWDLLSSSSSMRKRNLYWHVSDGLCSSSSPQWPYQVRSSWYNNTSVGTTRLWLRMPRIWQKPSTRRIHPS